MDSLETVSSIAWRVAVGAFVACSALAQQVPYYESGFDDGDLSFWTLTSDSPTGATLTVSEFEGNPPPSLELSYPTTFANTFAQSPCIPLDSHNARLWALLVDARNESPGLCTIRFVSYLTANCSDEGLAPNIEITESGTWRPFDVSPPAHGTTPLGELVAFRAFLHGFPSFSQTNPGACFFDNVVLLGPAEPIPAVSPFGMVFLASALVAAAIWWIRFRS